MLRPLRMPKELRVAPRLDPELRAPPPTPRHALLLNPFYAKDPHASFGKHVLTPSLALTSIAASTPSIEVPDISPSAQIGRPVPTSIIGFPFAARPDKSRGPR